MTTDSRESARTHVHELLTVLRSQPHAAEHAALIQECEALERAIQAFHMEGIRFRIFNVDRLLTRHAAALPQHARGILEEARRELEAAGFHTRSHQAPT